VTTVLVLAVELADGVGAWFTGRDTRTDPAVGAAGNLSHHRPHLPTELARDRAAACTRMGLSVDRLHLMRQVHGAAVGVVDAATPLGAELRGVDALVTDLADRPLVVQVADCVPVLLAAGPAVGVAHAGRRGVAEGVVPAAVAALAGRAEGGAVRAAIGPAIGGCCYEVPAEVRDHLGALHPEAATETTWGTPSLDLAVAVRNQLEAAGAAVVTDLASCTRCDTEQRWFSHRADPRTGRQLGVVVRRAAGARDGVGERAA
jgi:polyphenol oxidase